MSKVLFKNQRRPDCLSYSEILMYVHHKSSIMKCKNFWKSIAKIFNKEES